MEDNVKAPVSEETENNTPVEIESTPETETKESSALVEGVMAEKNIQQVTTKQRVMKICVQVGLYLFLGIMALAVLFPFYWMLISSVKTFNEYYDPRLTITRQLWPQTFAFENYSNVFRQQSLDRLFFNTLYVGVVSTILSLIITVLSAFAVTLLLRERYGRYGILAAVLALATVLIPA